VGKFAYFALTNNHSLTLFCFRLWTKKSVWWRVNYTM